jgi:hypothetical protein
MKFTTYLLFCAFLLPATLFAQNKEEIIKPTILKPIVPSIAKTVTAPPLDSKKKKEERDDLRNRRKPKVINLPRHLPDTVWQKNISENIVNSVNVILQQNGFNYQGVNPPDPSGDVGTNHYIHATNAGLTKMNIYNKNGTLAQGNVTFQSLGTLGSGFGDPIIVFDEIANRWIVAELDASSVFIYISQTASPTGLYFQYDMVTPDLPDYEKLGIWNDKLVITSNEGVPSIYVLDIVKMRAGLPVTPIRFEAPSLAGFPFQALTPVDVDGAQPSIGSTVVLFRHNDDESHEDIPNTPPADNTKDFIEEFKLNIDFINPGNSTMTGPRKIDIAEFDSDLCGLSSFDCILQPGAGNPRLDPLREVLMYRNQYRKFATYESIVMTLSTDVTGGDLAGVRWIELRKTTGDWFKYQEGTFAPNDGLNRWMASIAQDKNGNIALTYSVSSLTKFPSIRITGRKICDPLGQMTEPEVEVATGTNSSTSERWGDYQHLSVDPVTEDNFWFSGLYAAGNTDWRTRVVNFSLTGSCNCPANYSASVTITAQPSCANPTAGAVSITAVNGQAPYEYQLNAGTFQTSNIFTGLAAGSYTVNVKDANGCIAPAAFTLTQPATYTITPTVTQPISCFGGNNGGITVTPNGGTAPYQYQLNAGTFQGSNTFSNLSFGVYTINVKDANNCTATGNITLTQPGPLSTSIQLLQPISCFGGNDGVIKANPTSGTAPYQYSLNGVPFQGASTFSNLPIGTYTILVKDANNCISNGIITLTQPTAINVALQTSQVISCFGASDGAITVTASGGTPPYTYNVDGRPFQSSTILGNLAAGPHSILVKDSKNCTVTSGYSLTQPAAMQIDFIADTVKCFGQKTATASFSTLGGQSPYLYSLDGSAFGNATTFTSLGAGSHFIAVKDNLGCVFNQTIVIQTKKELATTLVSVDLTQQNNFNGLLSALNTNGGTGPYQFSLNGGTYQTNNIFSDNINVGSNSIKVKDVNGCIKEFTKEVGISQLTIDLWKRYVTLYPNPNNGDFILQIKAIINGNSFKLSLFDEKGSLIWDGTTGIVVTGAFKGNYRFNRLSKGNYLLKIQNSNTNDVVVKKVVVIK